MQGWPGATATPEMLDAQRRRALAQGAEI